MSYLTYCILCLYVIALIAVFAYSEDIGKSIFWPIYFIRFLITEFFNSFYK